MVSCRNLWIKSFIPEHSIPKVSCRRLLYGKFLGGAFYFGRLHPENFRFASSPAGKAFCAKIITDQISTKTKRSVIRPLLSVGTAEDRPVSDFKAQLWGKDAGFYRNMPKMRGFRETLSSAGFAGVRLEQARPDCERACSGLLRLIADRLAGRKI